jgi:hypothetical protein
MAQRCSEFIPDGQETRWTHEQRLTKMKEARKKRDHRPPQDYKAFFDLVVGPLNALAKKLQIADVMFLLAQSSKESGWLDEENRWLKNAFGLTMAGGDNLGFDTIQQSVDYWACMFGDRVRGAKTMQQYINGLQGKGLPGDKPKGSLCDAYNTRDPGYDQIETWDGQIHSVKIRLPVCGYEQALDAGLWVVRKKAD